MSIETDEPEDFPEEERIKIIDDDLRADLKIAEEKLGKSVRTLEEFLEEFAP